MLNNSHQLQQPPVIFLAFANDRGNYLYKLTAEQKGIRRALQPLEEAGLCEVVYETNAAIDDILDTFQKYLDRIAIFHYGGHADDYQLLLESADGGSSAAHGKGLVSFLGKQQGLELAFINGCSTRRQAEELTRAGVPAVIGTVQPVDDSAASDLSIRFYKGLARGLPLVRAWKEAVDQIGIQNGSRQFRAASRTAGREILLDFPWNIYYHEGAEARLSEWNIPTAAHDPLFGLPEIPEEYYRKLPAEPFKGLHYFRKEDAAIFFGRGEQIRQLYNALTGRRPIILFYGKSGVGKSSLLDAGLAPRIEADYLVRYIRRIPEKGLTGSLQQALGEAQGQFSKTSGDSPQPPATAAELLGCWREVEAAAGRPLLIILDQAEELYTRPLPAELNGGDELAMFLDILAHLFDAVQDRPQGKLILSYRKEYHPEIIAAFEQRMLPYEPVFLQKLDRRGIIEAVEGLTRQPDTRARYRLSIEQSSEGNLSEIIADDLLTDRDSPIAPMLQIILANLWQTALAENREAPCFRLDVYQELYKNRVAMSDFFEQQLAKLRDWNKEVVDSGLALDLLHFLTTSRETAGSRSRKELQEAYAHRRDVLDELLQRCQDYYLLIESRHSSEHLSLVHDTLAPVVIHAYNNADTPGQRAGRILYNKLRDFRGNGKGVYLDSADLTVVKKSRPGMRQLDSTATELLNISHRRRRNTRWRFTAALTLLLAIAYLVSNRVIEERTKYTRDSVSSRLKKLNYYDEGYNANGKGVNNQFEFQADGRVVYDAATDLYWEQSGSGRVNYETAKAYVDSLNRIAFADYTDWRLPTLEEAMTLMEPQTDAQAGIYIDTDFFNATQDWIWTANQSSASHAWSVGFSYGRCDALRVGTGLYVRAVRSP